MRFRRRSEEWKQKGILGAGTWGERRNKEKRTLVSGCEDCANSQAMYDYVLARANHARGSLTSMRYTSRITRGLNHQLPLISLIHLEHCSLVVRTSHTLSNHYLRRLGLTIPARQGFLTTQSHRTEAGYSLPTVQTGFA